MSLKRKLDARWYPHFEDEWDARAFRGKILERLRPDHRLLDIGAGRGATPHMHFFGLAQEVVGTDIDEAVLDNTQLNRAMHTPDGDLGELESGYFDLVVCKDVLEHVAEPELFFREVSRVLKPGGVFMGKTPNGGHYVPLIARWTPLWFHKSFNKMRGRETVDTFPTVYKANSRGALRRWAKRSGMELLSVEFQEGRPEYLRFNPAAYFLGMLYERTVNLLRLNGMKAVIYVTMRKL